MTNYSMIQIRNGSQLQGLWAGNQPMSMVSTQTQANQDELSMEEDIDVETIDHHGHSNPGSYPWVDEVLCMSLGLFNLYHTILPIEPSNIWTSTPMPNAPAAVIVQQDAPCTSDTPSSLMLDSHNVVSEQTRTTELRKAMDELRSRKANAL